MNVPVLTKGRVSLAFVVAIVADLLQFPLTLALVGSVLSGLGLVVTAPIEAIDLTIDLVAAALEVWLLGFHWALLPTALIEFVPGIDLAPTWTACVWWVVRSRRKAANVPVSTAV
jgi:hypothetical protein